MELAHDCVHKVALTATTRTKNKIVTVICHFLGTFLTRKINGHRNTLTVCVPEFQRRFFTFLLTLLIHHAERSITQRQETVIVRTELATVAGEAINKQFQLIIGTFGNLYVHLTEEVLQIVVRPGHTGVLRYGNNDIEVGIYQLFVLSGNNILNFLDVFDSQLIAWAWDRAVAILFLIEQTQFLFLVRHEDDLIIDS